MKQILLLAAVTAIVSLVNAQKKITAYAITGLQKGSSGWTEVRLVDITTGEEVQSIYKSANEVQVLNARTGKPVVKKDIAEDRALRATSINNIKEIDVQQLTRLQELNQVQQLNQQQNKTQLTNDALQKKNLENYVIATSKDGSNKAVFVRTVVGSIRSDKPFATSSAALAYDKKHERLYYTPMNIAQLRYIDLKTGNVFYFENEAFGVVQGRGDVQNQITRMVIASDGNGYAITNDANHLIRFTTGKNPVITDLGPLTDAASNGSYSVHSSGRFGGDVIADANKNLYLIGADRTVYKVDLETKVAGYLGRIKGLPTGFTTNGAVVEGGSSVIVTSSTSTVGYYRFDLNTLESEKVSTSSTVYNASDLANGTLAFEKEKKKRKERKFEQVNDLVVDQSPVKEEEPARVDNTKRQPAEVLSNSVSVYPNPVTEGLVKLSFNNQLPGKYQIQFMDITGRIISTKDIVISNKIQVEEFRLPSQTAGGNYMVKVVGESGKLASANKIVVQ